jgi:hypothetical protein
MPTWANWLLAILALAVAAPFFAVGARRLGRSARGGLALASMLLGFGQVLDPPSKHAIEAGEHTRKDRAAPGDPPLDEAGPDPGEDSLDPIH